MTATTLETIIAIIETVSKVDTIVLLYGMYLLYFKKKKVLGNHILAYSFFIIACYNVLMKRALIFVVITFIASVCSFKDYIYTKESA